MDNKRFSGEEYLCNKLRKIIEELKKEIKNKNYNDDHFLNVIKKELTTLYDNFFGSRYYKTFSDYKGIGKYDEVLAADRCVFNKLSSFVEKITRLVDYNQNSRTAIKESLRVISTLPRCYDNVNGRTRFKELLEDFYYCVDNYVTQFNKQNKKFENTKDSGVSSIKEEDYLCDPLEECIKQFEKNKKANVDQDKLAENCRLGLANFFKCLNKEDCDETTIEKDDNLANRIQNADKEALKILKNKKDKIEKGDLLIIQCAQILSVISKLYDGLKYRKKLRGLLQDLYYIFSRLV